MKFNGLLEWLQAYLPSNGNSNSDSGSNSKAQTKQKPLKEASAKRAEAENKRAAEQALEEEMIRDGKGTGTTQDAPDAQPAEGVEDGVGSSGAGGGSAGGGAAEPEPAEGVDDADESDGGEARETQHAREEL